MRVKLRLNVDELMVDSFTTEYRKEKSGTVHGHQCTCPTACTCPGCPTCDASCNGTCGDATFNGTCDASCGCGTNEYTCAPCTYQNDATCYNYGTCDPRLYCPDIP